MPRQNQAGHSHSRIDALTVVTCFNCYTIILLHYMKGKSLNTAKLVLDGPFDADAVADCTLH